MVGGGCEGSDICWRCEVRGRRGRADSELWVEGWEDLVSGGDGELGGACVEEEERRRPRRHAPPPPSLGAEKASLLVPSGDGEENGSEGRAAGREIRAPHESPLPTCAITREIIECVF